MQQEFSTEMAKAIAAHIYGDQELPTTSTPPAGCLRDQGAK
jgi:hypothetical protein